MKPVTLQSKATSLPEKNKVKWQFLATADGWYWEVTLEDKTTRRSKQHFETILKCIDDAVLAGYSRWGVGGQWNGRE